MPFFVDHVPKKLEEVPRQAHGLTDTSGQSRTKARSSIETERRDSVTAARSVLTAQCRDARVQRALKPLQPLLTDTVIGAIAEKGIMRFSPPGSSPEETLVLRVLDVAYDGDVATWFGRLSAAKPTQWNDLATLWTIAKTAWEILIPLAQTLAEPSPTSPTPIVRRKPPHPRGTEKNAPGPTIPWGFVEYVTETNDELPEPARPPEDPERKKRLHEWAEERGLTDLKLAAMREFLPITETVANVLSERLELSRFGVPRRELTLEGCFIVEQVCQSYDPRSDETFEHFLIPRMVTAMCQMLRGRVTDDILIPVMLSHTRKEALEDLLSKANTYAKAARAADRVSKLSCGQDERHLDTASKQEAIIVKLRCGAKQKIEEVADALSLHSERIKRILESVRKGIYGGLHDDVSAKSSRMERITLPKTLPEHVVNLQSVTIDLDAQEGRSERTKNAEPLMDLPTNHVPFLINLLTRAAKVDHKATRSGIIKNFFESIQHPFCVDANFERHCWRIAGNPSHYVSILRGGTRTETRIHLTEDLWKIEREKLIEPNLRIILEKHFHSSSKSPEERSLFDSDGSSGTHALASGIAGTVFALTSSHMQRPADLPPPHPFVHYLHQTFGQFLAFPEQHLPSKMMTFPAVDVMLLHKNLQQYHGNRASSRAVHFVEDRLASGGVVVCVFDATHPSPGSRADFLRSLGGRRELLAEAYAHALQQSGMPVSLQKAHLRLRAENGNVPLLSETILKDLPVDAHARENLQSYLLTHRADPEDNDHLTFDHALTFVIGRKV